MLIGQNPNRWTSAQQEMTRQLCQRPLQAHHTSPSMDTSMAFAEVRAGASARDTAVWCYRAGTARRIPPKNERGTPG